MKIFKKNNKKSSSPPTTTTNSPSSPSGAGSMNVGSPKYPKNEKFANSKVFGKKLPLDPNDLPPFVVKALSYLEEKGLNIEGIFRISPKKSDEDEIIQQLETNIKFDVPYEKYEIHLASSLLKLYLRELMDPLLTYEQYGMFLAAERIPDEEQRLVMIQKVIKFLPPTNFTILKKLCLFLKRVAANSNVNKMSPSNLAIVFAPNLLKSDLPQSHMEILQDSKYSSNLMTTLIAEAHSIFGDDSTNSNTTNNDNNLNNDNNTNNNINNINSNSNNSDMTISNNNQSEFNVTSTNNSSLHVKSTSGHLRPLPTPASPHLAFNQPPPVMFNPYEMLNTKPMKEPPKPPVMFNPYEISNTKPMTEPPIMEIMDNSIHSTQKQTNDLQNYNINSNTTNTTNITTNITTNTTTITTDYGKSHSSSSSSSDDDEMQAHHDETVQDDDHTSTSTTVPLSNTTTTATSESIIMMGEEKSVEEGSTIRKIKIPVRKRAIVRDVRRPLPNPNAPRYQSTVGNRLANRKSVSGYESDDPCIVDEEEME